MLGAGGTSVGGGGSSSGAAAAMGGLRLPSGGGGSAAAAAASDAGKKAGKKVPKAKGDPGANPRAFAFQSAGRAKASQARSAEKEQRRLHGELLFLLLFFCYSWFTGEVKRRLCNQQLEHHSRVDVEVIRRLSLTLVSISPPPSHTPASLFFRT